MLQVGAILESRYRLISAGVSLDVGSRYKAYDMQRDRLVVVQLLAPQLGGGMEAWDRLTRSQQAVAGVAQPGLIPFDEIGLTEGQLYLVRNHVGGQTLADLLAEAGPLRLEKALDVTIRLCEALAPAHRVGLVHGSLSPHSVLVKDDGQIAVIDTGLLPTLRPFHAPPGQPWGRSPYFTPEQAAGEDAHPASDVYVVGSLLYEMLAGRPPFRAHDPTVLLLQHLRQEPPALQILVPQAPPSLVQIVQKALAKEPAARYRNAGQLASILRSQLGAWLTPQPAEVLPAYPAQAGAQLVVPLPPTPDARAGVQSPRDIHIRDQEDAEWYEEPAGVDWLMITLIIAALVAVLGLIPLWRTVYRRYAIPSPAPTPILYRWREGDSSRAWACTDCRERRAEARAKLDDPGLVWYNLQIVDAASKGTGSEGVTRVHDLPEEPNSWLWESRLRVLATNCNTLRWQWVMEA